MIDPTGTDLTMDNLTDRETTMDNPTPDTPNTPNLDTVGTPEITLPNSVIARPINSLGEDAVLVALYTVDDTGDVDRFTSVSLVPVAGAVSILNAVREVLRIIAESKDMTIDELADSCNGEYINFTRRANGEAECV